MPQVLQISSTLRIGLSELRFTFARSSGPGGQNVNKVNTKAVLRWNVAASPSLPVGVRERFLAKYGRRVSGDGEWILTSDRHRDQGRNVADCLEKLRAMLLAVAQPPKPRKATKPSRGSIERRLETKRRVSRQKRQRRQSDESP